MFGCLNFKEFYGTPPLSLVSELISVNYPNYVRLRVKCIEGVLTSHLGSNIDPYYNQNRDIMNDVIKRFSCTRIT